MPGQRMSFKDKSLRCCDCGAIFSFSTMDQEYFHSRGCAVDPKRCVSCREAHRSQPSQNTITKSTSPTASNGDAASHSHTGKTT